MTKRKRLDAIKARIKAMSEELGRKRSEGTVTAADEIQMLQGLATAYIEANAVIAHVEHAGPVTVLAVNRKEPTT